MVGGMAQQTDLTNRFNHLNTLGKCYTIGYRNFTFKNVFYRNTDHSKIYSRKNRKET
jgi:hypothetical protein